MVSLDELRARPVRVPRAISPLSSVPHSQPRVKWIYNAKWPRLPTPSFVMKLKPSCYKPPTRASEQRYVTVPSVPDFPIWPRPVRQLMRPLGLSAEGMSVQQRFLEAISKNIANAETTRTPDGGAYRRQIAVSERDPMTGEMTTRIVEDASPGRMQYDPGHPDANADGYVEYPNVDINIELVDLMIARRLHEANASVFQAAKSMLRRALDI